MRQIMPQELEVWYLIPAIRRDLAKTLVKEHHFAQKDVAKLLGITESAVSQYLKGKRGGELEFNEKERAEIKKTAKTMAEKKEQSLEYVFHLSKKLMGSQSICEFHKKHDLHLPSNCDLCKHK